MVSLWLATHFLLKIYFIIDQLASSTFKIPYTVILTLHHRLQSDYNFQDLGCDLLQKLSAPPAFNDFLFLKLDCENKKNNFHLDHLEFIAWYLQRVGDVVSSLLINPVSLLLQLVPETINFFSPTDLFT